MESTHNRREFMKLAAVAAVALSSGSRSITAGPVSTASKKTIDMIALPYAENALEPFVSAKTVAVHYHNHHKGFYNTLKAYVEAHPEYQNQSVEELIMKCKDGILLDDTIFYISVLLYNHNRYWQSLKPKAGGAPKGKMGKLVTASYGTYDTFRAAFIGEAMKLGAGWVWVALEGDPSTSSGQAQLKVYRTEYHDTPLAKGHTPLLAIDVWEHAYYLDYQDDRKRYVEAVLDNLLNWEYAEKLLVPAKK